MDKAWRFELGQIRNLRAEEGGSFWRLEVAFEHHYQGSFYAGGKFVIFTLDCMEMRDTNIYFLTNGLVYGW